MLMTALHSLSVVAISASAHRLLRAMSIWTPEGILHGTPNPCELSAVALRVSFISRGGSEAVGDFMQKILRLPTASGTWIGNDIECAWNVD